MVLKVHVIKAHFSQSSNMSYHEIDLHKPVIFTQKWNSIQWCALQINSYMFKICSVGTKKNKLLAFSLTDKSFVVLTVQWRRWIEVAFKVCQYSNRECKALHCLRVHSLENVMHFEWHRLSTCFMEDEVQWDSARSIYVRVIQEIRLKEKHDSFCTIIEWFIEITYSGQYWGRTPPPPPSSVAVSANEQ